MLNKYYIEESNPISEEAKKTEVVKQPVSEESGQDGAADMEEQVNPETVTNEPVPVEEMPPAQEAIDEEDGAEEEPPKMVKANSRVKVKSASATAFKNDILNMSHEVCTILPLFTNLGALTADQIYAFGCCMDCFDPSEDTQESVGKVLDMLIAKNIVASYSPDGFNQSIYCLTAYGYDSMSKRSIAVDMKKMFSLSFGKYRFIGKDEMRVDPLLHAVFHNTFLLMYLGNMRNELREDVFELTKQSIRWEGDHYSINVFTDDSSYRCYVAVLLDDHAELLSKGNILLYEENMADAKTPPPSENKVFLHDGSSLYMWDGEWVKQTAAFDVNDAANEDTAGFGKRSFRLYSLPLKCTE